MTIKRTAIALLALGALLLPASQAGAADAPAWSLNAFPYPTNFAPGTSGEEGGYGPGYFLTARNVGTEATSGSFTITDTLPTGLTPSAVGAFAEGSENSSVGPISCGAVDQTVTCTGSGPLQPDQWITVSIPVDVGTAGGPILNEVSVAGGGAPQAAAIIVPTAIDAALASFGFLSGFPGLHVQGTNPDGTPATQAGSHPSELEIGMTFSNKQLSGGLRSIEGLRDSTVELPPGLIANPSATPQCTEAQLETRSCPLASQIGVVTIGLYLTGINPRMQMLYNMVPPPGSAASFGFDVANFGIYSHILAGVRSDEEYRAFGTAKDITAKAPILEVDVAFWGDPSDSSHDYRRQGCLTSKGSCPYHRCLASESSCPEEVPPLDTAFLTMPSRCSGPIESSGSIDSWVHPGDFKEASFKSTDAEGNPVGVEGCNALSFAPRIESKPTTNLIDSPSGLDFTLHQFQNQEFDSRSPANLKDATVTLPAGLAVNPAQANGMEACSSAQIGFEGNEGGRPHFSEAADNCPDAAKIGSVEVTTPLLDHPLPGDVYIAKPFDNPFDSLIAIYLSIDDPRSGVIAKLPGKVIPDPVTGQLTTRFTENPDLPLEDVELHLFGGARGALITPPVCGTYMTTSTLTPWSSPEGVDAHPADSFQTTNAPGGGTCPTAAANAPNGPSFTAGTASPQAGAYAPFLLKLSREDGSQRLTGIDTTLPPGLAAKFAGLATCSEAQIAAAGARSNPNEGALEKANPSCPAASEVGVVNVGAGAGPTPIYAQGHAYLAGPYKGAPLSLAIITPAVAGPFDLGAVVVRTALYVDPVTAQGRAVSDPLPTILHGIPLDLRSIAVKLDRPDFTLNPTSCNPMSVIGSAATSSGQSAALTNPFQVGGCRALPFKPQLALRLEGGTKRAAHPKLIATLNAKPGEANIAKASVTLPRSAFLDQAHIRTICTRVQFAANACPQGSIYGTATAVTPLFDQPLSGNVYLRSSNNKLPDLVVALKGPTAQPIEVDLAGRTDSVKGALRNSFEAVPDAPVSKFRLVLFGGRRGLVVNSRDLCAHTYRANVKLDGQNGKPYDTNPVVKSDCSKKRSKHKTRKR